MARAARRRVKAAGAKKRTRRARKAPAQRQELEAASVLHGAREYREVIQEKLVADPAKDPWALPSLMAETNGGGSVEKVPGFDVFRAATSGFETRQVAGPTTLLARPDGGYFTEGPVPEPLLPTASSAAGYPKPKTENVIGVDNRVMVTDTALTPWRCICHLEVEWDYGPVGFGTGFLIGPRAVVTAAHVISRPDKRRYARKIRVIPGRNGTTAPYGYFTTDFAQCRVPPEWTGRPDAAAHDYAVILAKKPDARDKSSDFRTEGMPTGQRLGYFGLKCITDAEKDTKANMLFVNNAGYPYEATKPYGSLWYNAGRVREVQQEFIEYMVDTEGGQSGSPVYYFDEEKSQRYVIAVHTTGDFVNRGVRITERVFKRIKDWAER
jgi:V8-like Glu-specific endopeptidase